MDSGTFSAISMPATGNHRVQLRIIHLEFMIWWFREYKADFGVEVLLAIENGTGRWHKDGELQLSRRNVRIQGIRNPDSYGWWGCGGFKYLGT